MAKFRKKPVVIEAARIIVNMGASNWYKLPDWLRAAYERGEVIFAPQSVSIRTLEGVMIGNVGDWIIRGVQGELYPCKDDIFSATYERVEETEDVQP